jgi:hypothetical protein
MGIRKIYYFFLFEKKKVTQKRNEKWQIKPYIAELYFVFFFLVLFFFFAKKEKEQLTLFNFIFIL